MIICGPFKLDGRTKAFKRGKQAHDDSQRLYSCANALSSR